MCVSERVHVTSKCACAHACMHACVCTSPCRGMFRIEQSIVEIMKILAEPWMNGLRG